MTADPLVLADLHLDVLYEQDPARMILGVRGDDAHAPLFHLFRTVDGNRWLVSANLSSEKRRSLAEALGHEPVVSDLEEMEGRPPVLSTSLNLAGSPGVAYRGPAFVFPGVLQATPADAELLTDLRSERTVPALAWVNNATPAERPLCGARNAAGTLVAVCHSARATGIAAEAGVETAPEHRSRGLGAAVVLGWAAAVHAQGRLPLYSTHWTNLPSRAIARKLGLIQYGEDYHYP